MMKNVSYIDDALEKSNKNANPPAKSTADSSEKMDVTELMNLIDKSKETKAISSKKTSHIDFNLIKSKEISNDDSAKIGEGNNAEDHQNNISEAISLTKPTPLAKRYIATALITTIAIVSFVGMLYFIDKKTEKWVEKQQPIGEQPKSKKTNTKNHNVNEQDLLRIISGE